jgi:hypothetical protein
MVQDFLIRTADLTPKWFFSPPSWLNGLSSFCHGQQEEKPTLGHTQPTESRQDNMKLGNNRTNSTKQLLMLEINTEFTFTFCIRGH